MEKPAEFGITCTRTRCCDILIQSAPLWNQTSRAGAYCAYCGNSLLVWDGHAGGEWSSTSSFTPSGFDPEEPVQTHSRHSKRLLYPKTLTAIANAALAQVGSIEIIPPEALLALFVWGPARVLPVRVNELSIAEEAYDTMLNPIRAKVDLTLKYNRVKDFGYSCLAGVGNAA